MVGLCIYFDGATMVVHGVSGVAAGDGCVWYTEAGRRVGVPCDGYVVLDDAAACPCNGTGWHGDPDTDGVRCRVCGVQGGAS